MSETLNLDALSDSTYLTVAQVAQVVPFSQGSIWQKSAAGTFPAPIKLSLQKTVWKVAHLRAWLAEREALSAAGLAPKNPNPTAAGVLARAAQRRAAAAAQVAPGGRPVDEVSRAGELE